VLRFGREQLDIRKTVNPFVEFAILGGSCRACAQPVRDGQGDGSRVVLTAKLPEGRPVIQSAMRLCSCRRPTVIPLARP
jgi:hypothetical protein